MTSYRCRHCKTKIEELTELARVGDEVNAAGIKGIFKAHKIKMPNLCAHCGKLPINEGGSYWLLMMLDKALMVAVIAPILAGMIAIGAGNYVGLLACVAITVGIFVLSKVFEMKSGQRLIVLFSLFMRHKGMYQ